MKNLLCLIGKHKFQQNLIFLESNKWLKQLKCIRCNYITEEQEITYGKKSRIKENSKRN